MLVGEIWQEEGSYKKNDTVDVTSHDGSRIVNLKKTLGAFASD